MENISILGGAVGILLLAALVEGFVQYTFGDSERARPYLKYVAGLLGIAAAIVYKVDIPSMFGLATDYGIANYIVSGIIIGRGSNYVNDIIGSIRGAN